MRGSISIPFSSLFADTCDMHGVAWAQAYYLKRGMPAWEFAVWLSGYRTAP